MIKTIKTNNSTALSANNNAKVANSKDIVRVLDFFRYNVGTSLDCARTTLILRNSITWYIRDLQEADMLRVVCVKPDSTTHYNAKHYSSDPAQWKPDGKPQQRSLFDDCWREEAQA